MATLYSEVYTGAGPFSYVYVDRTVGGNRHHGDSRGDAFARPGS